MLADKFNTSKIVRLVRYGNIKVIVDKINLFGDTPRYQAFLVDRKTGRNLMMQYKDESHCRYSIWGIGISPSLALNNLIHNVKHRRTNSKYYRFIFT